MKKILVIIALLWGVFAQAQLTFTAPVAYWTGVPTGAPSQKGSRIAVNLTTNRLYQWDSANTEWDLLPYGIDEVTGCAAPAYTPDIGDSPFAINRCSIPELYYYFSGSWKQVGGGGGTTYTEGYGIDIATTVISVDTSVIATLYDVSQVIPALQESYIGYGNELNRLTGDTALVWIEDSLRMGINWTNPTAELTLKGAPNAVTTSTVTDFQASVFTPENYVLGGDWIANDIDRQFDNATGSGTLTFLIGALSDDFLYSFAVNVTNYTDKITLSIGGTDYEITSAGTFNLSGIDLTGITEIYFTAAGGPTTIKTVTISHVILPVSSASVMDVINPGTGLPYPQFGLVVTNSSLSLSGTLKNNSGTDNIAIGANALKQNTIGAFNTAIGANALSANTNFNNTAIGSGALRLNASGTNNLAIGLLALGNGTANSNNTAVGSGAGQNATGSNNIFVGQSSGANASTGASNIYIGALTGVNNSGSNNTAVGSGSGNSGSASRCIYLGASAGAGNNVSDRLYIEPTNSTTPLISGNFSTDRVGINKNITALGATLDVGGTAIITSTTTGTPALTITSATGGVLLPRLTTVQRTALTGIVAGTLIFNTTNLKFEGWDGTAWMPLN